MRLQFWPLCLLAFAAPFSCGQDAPPETRVRPASPELSSLRPADLEVILQCGSPERRIAAAKALGQKGRDARAAIPTIIQSLQDEETAVVDALWDALEQIGAPSSASLLRLRCSLKEQVVPVRRGAAGVLALMGQDAEEALPDLVEALGDRDCSVQLAARHALVSIGNAAVPGLLESLLEGTLGLARLLIEILAPIPDGAVALSSLGDTAIDYLLRLDAPPRSAGARPR